MGHPSLSSDSLKLVIGFDIGTAYTSVSFALAPRDIEKSQSIDPGKISAKEPIAVSFNGRHQVSSQLAWCDEESTWVWGDYIDELVDDGSIHEMDRIQMLKLSIEGSWRTERIRQKVNGLIDRLPFDAREQLMTPDSPTPGDLIAMYLKLLWVETQAQIKGHYAKSSAGNIFDNRMIECWISVPKLWSPQMNAIIVSAADWAGLPEIHLVHEPEAAAAFCLLEQSECAFRYGQSSVAGIQGIHAGVSYSLPSIL